MSHRVLTPRLRPLRRALRRDQSGAAAVEFAIVAIPFFLLLYGLVVFGMALAVKQSVTNAAAEGARSAVGIPVAADAVAKAETTVRDRLSWLGTNYQQATDLTVTWYTPNANPALAGTCGASTPPAGSPKTICVVIDLPYKARGIVPAAPIIDSVTPQHLRSTAIVQVG